MVTVAEHSRPPQAPRTEDFRKVMDSLCPFHPKGKHAAKDCFTLKKFAEEQANRLTCDQGGPGRNQDQQQGGPEFPNAERELHIIYGGSNAHESKWKQKLTTREINE